MDEYIFSDDIISHLSTKFKIDESKIKKSLDSYYSDHQLQVKFKCCNIVNKPCGKSALNKVVKNGKELYYCGSEKVGCYKTIFSEQKSPANKGLSSKLILEKVSDKPLEFEDVILKNKKKCLVDNRFHIVFENDKACGRLENGSIIKNLTQNHIRYLEANNYQIHKSVKPKTQVLVKKEAAKLFRPISSSEESENEEEDEELNFDEESEEESEGESEEEKEEENESESEEEKEDEGSEGESEEEKEDEGSEGESEEEKEEDEDESEEDSEGEYEEENELNFDEEDSDEEEADLNFEDEDEEDEEAEYFDVNSDDIESEELDE
ncbi:hypothetical protein OAG24_00640 [bacterium]|nr:hypothetical protein [bacterium]